MKSISLALTIILLLAISVVQALQYVDPGYKVATVVNAATLDTAMTDAPVDSVSDQPIIHVESAEGRLGIGVVHRPVIEAGGPIEGILHHKQSEVYRVMAGSGTLVTSTTMMNSKAIDSAGYIVRNLTGPSDRGVIENGDSSQLITTGDVVIIPAGVAHGFSEITEAITYMVVRIDPLRLVELK
ncbi:MAG: hypothetical protein O3A13_05690 [Proteobacteria bacterium]|nr:hypothetical protein [Pseudomonadota bacterium]MDA0993106.1 hypothetical protein [Pseudomonadota bacterium]